MLNKKEKYGTETGRNQGHHNLHALSANGVVIQHSQTYTHLIELPIF
jgi:hypothetical protein